MGKQRGVHPVRNLYMRELIGSSMRVLEHTDGGLVGREGLLVDETRNTLSFLEGERTITLPKKGSRLEIQVDLREGLTPVSLDGDLLMFRPEDRIKRNLKRNVESWNQLRVDIPEP